MRSIGIARSPIRKGPASRDPLSLGWTVCGLLVVLAFLGCQTPAGTVEADELNAAAPAVSPIEVLPRETSIKVQAVETAPKPAATARGKIVVKSVLCDFGDVTPAAKPKGFFEFKNEGQGPLRITRVQGCCGAVIKLSKNGQVVDAKKGLDLAPGETGRLDVTYSFTYIGPMEKKIHLFTDDPDNKNVVLTIKGRVVRKLSWTPARLRLYRDKENAGCPSITIKSLDGKPFALNSFRVTGNCMSLDVDPNREATEFTLQPQVAIDVLQAMEMTKGRLTIEHTHPGSDAISLNFDLIPRYVHLPARYILFNADPAVKFKRRLHVLDNYAEDQSSAKGGGAIDSVNVTPVPPTFELESITSEKGTAVLTKQEIVNNGYKLYFDITPPKAGSERRFQDEIVIRIKGGKERRVAIQGYYSQRVLQEAQRVLQEAQRVLQEDRRPSVSQIPR